MTNSLSAVLPKSQLAMEYLLYYLNSRQGFSSPPKMEGLSKALHLEFEYKTVGQGRRLQQLHPETSALLPASLLRLLSLPMSPPPPNPATCPLAPARVQPRFVQPGWGWSIVVAAAALGRPQRQSWGQGCHFYNNCCMVRLGPEQSCSMPQDEVELESQQ